MRLRSAVATAATLLPLLAAGPATAAPPEGCVGFPDLPQAFVCIESFTPENAVPSVTPGSETVWIPEFCVFACVGPTPVTVPLAAVTPNSGTVAVVRYMGQDYPISTAQPLPPDFPPAPGATAPPDGFAGKGCSLLAVEDPTQPDQWIATVQGGPVVATDDANEIWSWGCIITIDDVYIGMGTGPATTTIEYDGDTSTLGVCLDLQWRRDGEPFIERSCASAMELGTARVVV